MNVFDLEAVLTLDSSGYDSGLDAAEGNAHGFGGKLTSALGTVGKASVAAVTAATAVGAAAAGAFVGATRSVAEYGDNIDKMSQKMGMSAQAYQEWDAVMRHSGTSMETLKASMKTLASAAETGKDAFDRLGISQQQIASMSQEELFSATITALQGVTDETERTYLAGQLLGRGATELSALLNTSAADTQAMKDRVHELGGVMSDESVKAAARFQDSLQDMQTAIDGAKRSLSEGILPAIADIMDGIGNVVSGFDVEGGLQQIEQGVDNFINNLNDVIPRVAEMAGRIIPAFAKAIATNLPTLAQTGLDLILQLGQGIASAIPSLIARLPAIIVGIVNFITSNLPAVLQTGIQIIIGIIQGIGQAIPALIAAAPQILLAIGQGILGALQVLWDNGPEIVSAIGEGILNALGALGELGLKIVTAIGEGILSALGWFGDVIGSLFSDGKSEADARAADFRHSGERSATEITTGFESKKGLFSGSVSASLQNTLTVAEAKSATFNEIGETSAINLDTGWNAAESAFNFSVSSTLGDGIGTAEGFASSWLATGTTSMNNLASGIDAGSALVGGSVGGAMAEAQASGDAAAAMFGSVGDSMITQTVSHIASAAQSVSSAARGVVNTAFIVANTATAVFTEVGSNMARGIARGITAGSPSIASAARAAVAAALSAAKAAAAIASPSKKFRDEVGYFMGLGMAKGLEDSEDKAVKAAVKLAQNTYSNAQEWIRRNAKFNDWSLTQQLEVWDLVQAGFVEGSQQYLDAEEKIFDLRRDIEEEYFDNAKKQIQQDTKFRKLSLSEQLAAWESLQAQYAKDSKRWAQAEEEIFDLREKILDNFASSVESLWKNVTDAQDKYSDQLTKRVDEIAGAYDLFADVQDRQRVSGAELTTNLTRQVNVLTDFYDGLEKLSARGVSSALVEEIRDMGPKAVDNLEALLAMTDNQLTEYAALYEEKQALANRVALDELAGLKAETDAQIAENMRAIRDLYDHTAPTLGEAFTDGMAQGILDGIPDVVAAAVKAAQEATNAAKRSLGKVVTFRKSGMGASSAGIINSIGQRTAESGGGVTQINLVTPDGGVLARYMFDPLKRYAAASGQPIVNPA